MANQEAEKARTLRQRLAERARLWPRITELTVRCSAGFAHVDALLDNGDRVPLCRLRDTGDPERWDCTLYVDSTGPYDSTGTTSAAGRPSATPEEALDLACRPRLGPPVTGRIAHGADLAAAADVWRRANAARGRPPNDRRIARVRDKLSAPDALVLVAAAGDEVLGMALAEPGREEDGRGELSAELCHISMVFVHPDHWGRRIGLVLLEGISAQAHERGYATLQLWTGAGNERAQRLYRRAGFTSSGRTLLLERGEPVVHFVRAAAAPGRPVAPPRRRPEREGGPSVRTRLA
jgi:ribosomal protein S18 acetylase RimI-like enzyme